MQLARSIGAQGFPSLILEKDGQYELIPVDYNKAQPVLNTIQQY